MGRFKVKLVDSEEKIEVLYLKIFHSLWSIFEQRSWTNQGQTEFKFIHEVIKRPLIRTFNLIQAFPSQTQSLLSWKLINFTIHKSLEKCVVSKNNTRWWGRIKWIRMKHQSRLQREMFSLSWAIESFNFSLLNLR